MFSIVQTAPRTVVRSGLRAATASSSRHMGTRFHSSSSSVPVYIIWLLDSWTNQTFRTQHDARERPRTIGQGESPQLIKDPAQDFHSTRKRSRCFRGLLKADKSDALKEDMQAETIKFVKARHHEDGSDTLEAYYHRDEVTGPLSSKGKEEVIVHNGKVAKDRMIDDPVAAAMIRNMRPTQSEINVKADRGKSEEYQWRYAIYVEGESCRARS
ncbi:hypothetical protein BDQ17DRAFT_1325888 [Cyathus striatus]|nr:hypothetical protein BDQ17DRAFT_1325888 [Cyathus striatus]